LGVAFYAFFSVILETEESGAGEATSSERNFWVVERATPTNAALEHVFSWWLGGVGAVPDG